MRTDTELLRAAREYDSTHTPDERRAASRAANDRYSAETRRVLATMRDSNGAPILMDYPYRLVSASVHGTPIVTVCLFRPSASGAILVQDADEGYMHRVSARLLHPNI